MPCYRCVVHGLSMCSSNELCSSVCHIHCLTTESQALAQLYPGVLQSKCKWYGMRRCACKISGRWAHKACAIIWGNIGACTYYDVTIPGRLERSRHVLTCPQALGPDYIVSYSLGGKPVGGGRLRLGLGTRLLTCDRAIALAAT